MSESMSMDDVLQGRGPTEYRHPAIGKGEGVTSSLSGVKGEVVQDGEVAVEVDLRGESVAAADLVVARLCEYGLLARMLLRQSSGDRCTVAIRGSGEDALAALERLGWRAALLGENEKEVGA